MKRVYLADSHSDERSAFRLLLLDLNLKIVGESADWQSTLRLAPATRPDLVLVDWSLVDNGSGARLLELRKACADAVVIVLISHLDARDQAALSAGADAFISKGETSERVVERLRAAVSSLPI
jgi:two-component system, NarL family, nitrate/nitrite response regulator NarL